MRNDSSNSNKSIHYKDVDDAYRKLFPELANYASRMLANKDQSIDAVHDAFDKVIQWQARNPQGNISHKQIYRLVLRACRKINRHNRFISIDDPVMAPYMRTKHPEIAMDLADSQDDLY